MSTPRIAAIHDMSGFGRCSLTVAMPILSAMGIQCCPLPTAFLSTHTGGFEGFTFLDMTDELPKVAAHWKSLNLDFQAIYSGFLGSERQIAMVEDFLLQFRSADTVAVIDPVMGDHGEVYQTYTPAMCAGMARLAELADVITPNLTEAALLLGVPYGELPVGEAGCREIVERLSLDGHRSVVLTLFPGIQESIIDSVLHVPGLKAVVLKTYGSGNAPQKEWLIRQLKEASDRGIVIVNITQCQSGSVEMGRYETGLQLLQAGVISGYDSTPECAVTKLMFLLGHGLSEKEIRHLMNSDLAGEITK